MEQMTFSPSFIESPTRFCRKCNAYKLRAEFVPRRGPKAILEKWCAPCRTKYRKELFTPAQMRRREALGRHKIGTAERENTKIKARRNKAGTANIVNWRRNKNKKTWALAARSARLALRRISEISAQSKEELLWLGAVHWLLIEARTVIIEKRATNALPTHKLVFWYDAVPGVAAKLRALIDDYPLGADKSPFQMM